MINRFRLLRNIGQFDSVTATAHGFQRLTLLYAENGRGKTTLSALFRSLAGAGLAPASAVLANAVRTDVGPGIGCSLFVGQRTFETRSLYLILAEKLFTLSAANEMLPRSTLFTDKYREGLLLGSDP